MVDKNIQFRNFAESPSVRTEGDSRTIEGYAIVFNQRSEVLWRGATGDVVEVIDPEAVNEELLRNSDVIACMEHDRKRMLARSRFDKGSLTLEIDAKGLKYRFVAPNTADGNYALEMIERGDIFGSSFAFTTDETDENSVKYSQDGDTIVRTIKRFTGLYDVSMVANPAYLGTSVGARSNDEAAKELGEIMQRSQPGVFTKEPQQPSEEELRKAEQIREEIAQLRSNL